MDISVDIEKSCELLIKKLQLPAEFINTVHEIYLPLAQIILNQLIVNQQSSSPLLVSINGLQGSGKSTLTLFLKEIIESQFNKNVVEFSIDDFYLTRSQRKNLAQDVHPLLATRGVPGTHDIAFLEKVLDDLFCHRSSCIPRFDKAIDERCKEEQWTQVNQPVDIILFEGWCNNSPVQSEKDLVKPVNELEAREDTDGVWRRYVNECLQEYHQRVFNRADLTMMLQTPSFDSVYEWRQLQEEKNRLQSAAVGEEKRLMDDYALRRFIQHYERISRHTLLHLPQQVDLVLPVNAQHYISSIRRKDN